MKSYRKQCRWFWLKIVMSPVDSGSYCSDSRQAELPVQSFVSWKRPWCWERLKAAGEGDDRGWDGWMASLTWWTWVWAGSQELVMDISPVLPKGVPQSPSPSLPILFSSYCLPYTSLYEILWLCPCACSEVDSSSPPPTHSSFRRARSVSRGAWTQLT